MADKCVVSSHIITLRACGFWPASELPLHCAWSLCATSAYLAQECVYAWQAAQAHDAERMARVMFLLLCHLTSLAKQVVLILRRKDLAKLVASLEDSPGSSQIQARARAKATLVQRSFAGTAAATCSLWAGWYLRLRCAGEVVDLPFWMPFEYQSPGRFAAVLFYSYYVTTLVGVANTTMDAFIAAVLDYCKTQLIILRINLENITEKAAERTLASREEYEVVLMRMLVESVHHYQRITDITKQVVDIFGTATLLQFGVGGWILCMAAYRLVGASSGSVEATSMCMFIACILTELLLYCFYGNEVTVESTFVTTALYSCGWERGHASARFRRALLVFMGRAHVPLRAAAGRVVPLSLDTFVKILKSSYTFYAVLRQTK